MTKQHTTEPTTKSITYKGASLAKRGIKHEEKHDWVVVSHTTYRKWWSMWTGFLLFRRRRHVVTFAFVPQVLVVTP